MKKCLEFVLLKTSLAVTKLCSTYRSFHAPSRYWLTIGNGLVNLSLQQLPKQQIRAWTESKGSNKKFCIKMFPVNLSVGSQIFLMDYEAGRTVGNWRVILFTSCVIHNAHITICWDNSNVVLVLVRFATQVHSAP